MGLDEAMCVNGAAYNLSSGPVLTIGFHCHYQGFLPVKGTDPYKWTMYTHKVHTHFAMTKCKVSLLSHLAHGM